MKPFTRQAIIASTVSSLVLTCHPPALAQAHMDLLHSKELLKAKFAASRADVSELKRERLAAARGEYEARQSEFLAGRGTLVILFEASRKLLDSELAMSANDSQRATTLQRYWSRALLVERTNDKLWAQGRIPYKVTRESEYERLDGEIRLARLRSVKTSPHSVDALVPLDRLNSKEFAKDKHAAALADPHDLAIQKLEAIMAAYPGRLMEFLAGRGSTDIDLETSRRWLEAERALARRPKELVSALERHWETIWVIENVNKVRYQAGRLPIQEFLQPLHSRLQAELELLKFRISPSQPIPWTGARLAGFLFWVWESYLPGELKHLAKDKFAVGLRGRGRLLHESLSTVQGQLAERANEFVRGRGTLDILLEIDRDLLAAELAIARSRQERLAAFVRHFEHAAFFEAINRARYEAARIPPQEYLQTVSERLDAELQMLQEERRKVSP